MLSTTEYLRSIREDRSTLPPSTTIVSRRAAGRTAPRRQGGADQPDGRKRFRQRGQESRLASSSGGMRRGPFRHPLGRDAYLLPELLFHGARSQRSGLELPNALIPLQSRGNHCGGATTGACSLQRWLNRGGLRSQAGTCTRSLMCLRFATMVNVITTSSDHELHLPMCTLDHAPS